METDSNDKIRVLHFIYTLQGGGAERQLQYLVNGLDNQRFTSAICCADPTGYEKLPDNIELFVISRKTRFDLRWRPITKLIQSWKPDIVHNWLPVTLFSSLLPSRTISTKYIGCYRNAYWINNLTRLLQAIGFLFVDELVSNVHVDEQNFPFANIFRAKFGHYIPNGIAVKQIREAEPTDFSTIGIQENISTFLYAGRLVPQKNIKILLRSLPILEQRGFDFQLLLCGDGIEKQNLQTLVSELGLSNKVMFLGYRSDIHSIMKRCDALILPSFHEGMPNILFEAMAANLPIIASDIPVHKRWVDNDVNGILFDLDSPGQLASLLEKIIIEPLSTKQKRIANADHCISNISVARMVSTYDTIYTDLLHKG